MYKIQIQLETVPGTPCIGSEFWYQFWYQSVLAQTPIMVIGHNKYQGLCHNGWQVMPILTLALMERPPVLRTSV
uniref:Uncharacterized protein n=1 Tax=Romanomermis culicivorax TaxID=13658 RepID=A0A915HTE3_ROMCU